MNSKHLSSIVTVCPKQWIFLSSHTKIIYFEPYTFIAYFTNSKNHFWIKKLCLFVKNNACCSVVYTVTNCVSNRHANMWKWHDILLLRHAHFFRTHARVWFVYELVYFLHAQVRFLHANCNFHTQSVIMTRTSVISTLTSVTRKGLIKKSKSLIKTRKRENVSIKLLNFFGLPLLGPESNFK
jgi:hypothetical protein